MYDLSQSDLEEYKDAFELFDKTNKGYITTKDIRLVINSFNMKDNNNGMSKKLVTGGNVLLSPKGQVKAQNITNNNAIL